jgi:Protein of unknown function (DUF3363)
MLAIATPTGKVAVIRREDTFTFAPWKPPLERFRGRAVTGMIGPNRVSWTLDRSRACRVGREMSPSAVCDSPRA